MKKTIDFTKEGGFPFTQDTLRFMQDSYKSILQTIIGYLGIPSNGHYIISGLKNSGRYLTEGWVVIYGEVLPFKSGVKGNIPRIIIREKRESVDFKEKKDQQVYIERWAEVSQSGGEALTSFRHIKNPDDLLPRDGSLSMTGAIRGNGIGGELVIKTQTGTTTIGSSNTGSNHFGTDRQTHYFNKKVHVNGDIGLYSSNTYMRFSDGAYIERGSPLVNKYLGKNAKSKDSDKLNGINGSKYYNTNHKVITYLHKGRLTFSGVNIVPISGTVSKSILIYFPSIRIPEYMVVGSLNAIEGTSWVTSRKSSTSFLLTITFLKTSNIAYMYFDYFIIPSPFDSPLPKPL